MSKKGFTVIEMMATFILVSVAAALLVRLAITVKEIYTVNDLKTVLLVKQGNFMYKLYHDIDTKELNTITTSDNSINFNFSDNTTKKLTVNSKNKTISYGNFTYKLTDSNYINSITDNSENLSDGNIFALNISIKDKLVGGDFGLNIVFETEADIPNLNVFDVSSRNRNLVSNGDLFLKNNSNFTEFGTYENGHIKKTSNTRYIASTDEFIKINPSKRYKLSFEIKSSNSDATYYLGYREYDMDYNEIKSTNYTYMNNTLTYLDENIDKDDLTIKLHDTSNWTSSPSKDCQRGIIVWNYKNSRYDIYLHPTNTGEGNKYLAYSRNVYTDLFEAGNISNNTITLKQKWEGPNIKKTTTYDVKNSLDGSIEHITTKTYVSQSNCINAPDFKHNILNNETIDTIWYPYDSSVITGTINNGSYNGDKFSLGTVYIKPTIYANYNNTSNTTTYVTNVSFIEQ